MGSGVNARMDSKFPHHPLMPSEASYKKNVEAAELNMLRKTMGAAMPLKLAMERKAASKVGHLPAFLLAVQWPPWRLSQAQTWPSASTTFMAKLRTLRCSPLSPSTPFRRPLTSSKVKKCDRILLPLLSKQF